MSRIQHPVLLEGALVRLEPLDERHFDSLIAVGKDPVIWENLPVDGTDSYQLLRELRTALLHRSNETQYPFTVIDTQSDRIIGSTRLMEIFREHRKLEIGWTWYDPAVWGKGHNLECKLLLLTYCFETLRYNRVQLKTRNTNKRSQAAIRKIGGVYEGSLRKDRIMPDGQIRDTAVFSIINDEWPEVKTRLSGLLKAVGPVLE